MFVVLDFSLPRCAWRAPRRSREHADFWHWLVTYRHRSLPPLRNAINTHGRNATLHVLRHPRALDQFITRVAHEQGKPWTGRRGLR